MKAAARALVIALVLAIGAWCAAPYWRATALILRAADGDGLLGRAASWNAHAVTDRLEWIATPEGTIRLRTFSPSGRPRGAVLLVSGVHPDGIDEPRLIDLARDLSASGVTVATPEIPDLQHYRLTPRVTDTIEHVGEWLAANPAAMNRRIGMIGVSFSGGLSVVAAARAGLRDRVAYVLSFGGHGDLPRVLRYLCTGLEPALPGAPAPARRRPHDYALAVLLYQAADLAVPADQAAPLRAAIAVFLEASALTRLAPRRAEAVLRESVERAGRLPEPAATLMRQVNARNVEAIGAVVLPYLPQLGQDASLSPERSPAPSAPVYLLHGLDDNVIPAVESELLARYLRPLTRTRILLSGFLTHVDVAQRPTLPDTWRMIAFWAAALSEQ